MFPGTLLTVVLEMACQSTAQENTCVKGQGTLVQRLDVFSAIYLRERKDSSFQRW